ncbi:tetratricopeptide repeat protein [Vicingus serpentipes]|nr:tetratricopeptide repeat protein [Vicingus serpentipes]
MNKYKVKDLTLRIKYLILVLIVNSVSSIALFAQKTTIYTHEISTYNSASELFDKEKYSAAQDKFADVLKTISDKKSEVAVNAKYYHALCGLRLFNTDAENLFIEFINEYPESPKVKLAYFYLGTYHFRGKKYDEALAWFAKIDAYDLSPEELAEYHFKKGYSYFINESYDEASKEFYEIKDVDNKYAAPAKYYYAHVAYLQQKYESSLETFLQLNSNPKFSPITPYYITQIYYLQKKYDKLIEYAPALLDTAIPNRTPEIARLIGESYYRSNKFNEAIPYLKRYQKEKPYEASRADQYQLGYALYKADSCDQAIEWFKKSINENDSISQTAHYHLAECYLKLNNKQFARSSFRAASQADFDPQIKEDALFSFAKISYELSFHPFNDAIKAFEEYINTYPNSKKLSSAYEYLVAVYYTTKNYKAAIQSLENIKTLDNSLQEAYQKIAHYRGIELFNNRQYEEAISYFDKSDKYLLNPKIKAENIYWRAESFYRLNNFSEAIGRYKKFIYEPEAIGTENLNKAYYHIGYAYFELKEYSNAKTWFRKYNENTTNIKSSKIKNDALNRTADCFFMEQDYKAAIEYYDKATMIGVHQIDYSLYQSAIANGVVGNYKEKANLLETLINQKQNSHLLDDAIYELAEVQLLQNNNDKALENFKKIKNNHPTSPYVSKSLVKEGLIYYNKKDDNNALIVFKEVVKTYPNTDESKESLEKIKKIYIDQGDLATYETYLGTVGSTDAAALILDADYYEVAENSYMGGNCDRAVSGFAKYLEKYPKGTYALNAHFYKATCEYKSGFNNEALIDYNYVIQAQKNNFSENALLAAAKINLELGKTDDALNNYNQLEYLADNPENVFKAQVEQMRLNYQFNNIDATIKYCEIVINKDIDDANLITETHLIYAKALLALDNYNKALKEFTTASMSPNKFGAEAKYNVAHILYLRGEYDNCEAEIFSLIKKFPGYDYWMGKSLILLADNYVSKEDLFQAKVTFQNIIDNSKYPELVNIATEKLNIIKEQEASKRVAEQPEEVELNFGNELDIEKLFSDPEPPIEEEEIPLPKQNKEEKIIEEKDSLESEPKEKNIDEEGKGDE